MHIKKILSWLLPVFILTIFLVTPSCNKKDKFLTSGGEVSFSSDTLMFDTVFTAQGSATRSIRIFNKQKEKIKITSIRLRKGANSPYRLNINGQEGKQVNDVEIAGNDSVWVFAAVTIDPTNENLPFVVDDDLVVTLNGQEYSIPFVAFGQNAYYIVDSLLGTQTWLADKPYVIIRNALVDTGATLTIPAGARIYLHKDSRLFVQGTLKVNGTQADSVIFQGDRIDPLVWIGDYIDLPGQWGGLYFTGESSNNEINYTVIKNGGVSTRFGQGDVQPAAIQVDKRTVPGSIPTLKITNSVIKTSQGYGILSFGGSITAENCRIVECGAENIMFFEGGDYKLYDCTIGTFGSQFLAHSDNGSMAILNYRATSQTDFIGADLKAELKNCIIYGSLDNEIFFDKKDNFLANVTLQNCLIKSVDPIAGFVNNSNNISNQDPLFKDISKDDYHLLEGSPAIGTGVTAGSISIDLDGKTRATPPSIGCYEYQP
jgi:hypothetical protein